MKITEDVCRAILDRVPEHLPEMGGMLGGSGDTITEVVFDEGRNDGYRKCHYTPNVNMLNNVLGTWQEQNIEFYGLFHTHFFGVASLSDGDTAYIRVILQAMPDSKKTLYFPVVVLPEKKIISYRCSLSGEEVKIAEEPFIITGTQNRGIYNQSKGA